MSIKSNKIRHSAKGETCTLRLDGCKMDSETTVLCHIPGTGQKGMSQKVPDVFAVYACHHCHDIIDGRKKGEWEYRDIVRAWAETLNKLIEKGLVIIK